jgi:hypothetical protein
MVHGKETLMENPVRMKQVAFAGTDSNSKKGWFHQTVPFIFGDKLIFNYLTVK